jgi:hypothetical protein
MRAEAIDFLIRKGINVTEDSISKVLASGFSPKTPEVVLNTGTGINRDFMGGIYDFALESMRSSLQTRADLESRFDKLGTDLGLRFDKLDRTIETVNQELKLAQVLEKGMSGYVKTINLDLSDQALINLVNTTATIAEGIAFGVVKDSEGLASQNAIRMKQYPASAITATIRTQGDVTTGRIELMNASGIGYVPQMDEPVVNSDRSFRIVGESDLGGKKRMDILVDRGDSEVFNQIEVGLDKAHLAQVFLSEDGLEFSKVFEKEKYIKNTVLPVGSSTARYIKITIYKNKHDAVHNGVYLYAVGVTKFNMLKSTLDEVAVLETNKVAIDGAYSVLALSTCDNFSDVNADITYKISIDDGEWKTIRPVDKKKVGNVIEPVTVRLNDYAENKLISLTDFSATKSGYTSPVDFPQEFVLTNDLRVFAEDMTETGGEWEGDSSYKKVYGMITEARSFDIGGTEMQINGKWATGLVKLNPGLYEVKVRTSNYANLFNSKNASVVNEVNGEYSVTDNQGVVRVIADPLYPYNHKIIVEDSFDLLFKKELIEKQDYTLYNSQAIYNLSTYEKYNEIIVSYRLHQSNASHFKLRAEMKSSDKTTMPYCERALIRMS